MTHETPQITTPEPVNAEATETTWTFCGHWENDRIVVDYVLPGEVQDERIDVGRYAQGLWAEAASGPDVATAQARAIARYEASIADDDVDDPIDYHAGTPLDPRRIVVDARVSVPDWRSGTVVGWTDGTVTEVRNAEEPTFVVRLDSTGQEALYFPYSIASANQGRYTVLVNDGLPGRGNSPEPPSPENTTDTLAGAQELFRDWLRDSGNDYTRAPGYEAPWADVVLTSSWDGISYGDISGGDGVVRLTRGPNGGVVREGF